MEGGWLGKDGSKMAGFGASHQGFSQPKKSSVNFYKRLFCTIAATAGKIVNQAVSYRTYLYSTKKLRLRDR